MTASLGGPAFAQTAGPVAAARALAIGGDRPGAVAQLRQRLVVDPTDSDARTLLGIVLSWDGEYDEARTVLQ